MAPKRPPDKKPGAAAKSEATKAKATRRGPKSKYRPNMCATVLEMMSEGASQMEVQAAIGITRETFNQWTNRDGPYYEPDFTEAVERGRDLSQAWWERLGRMGAVGEDINPSIWIFNMKARFGWRDKVEVSGDPEAPVKQEIEHKHTLTDWDAIEAKIKQHGG